MPAEEKRVTVQLPGLTELPEDVNGCTDKFQVGAVMLAPETVDSFHLHCLSTDREQDRESQRVALTPLWTMFEDRAFVVGKIKCAFTIIDRQCWSMAGVLAQSAASSSPLEKPLISTGDADVTIVGSCTLEERDAEGRKRAIDLDSTEERECAKTAPEGRVARARSACDAAIKGQVRALMRPVYEAHFADEIGDAELGRRKRAASEQATADFAPLATSTAALCDAYAAYSASAAARAAAELAVDRAVKQELAAEATLEAALRAVEAAAPGALAPLGSGMMKSE